MKKIAVPAITLSAILLASLLATVIPLNVKAGPPPDILVDLTLECDEVDNTISAKLVFYFTEDGTPIPDTLTVLECDKDDPVDEAISIGIGASTNDFHKNIKIFRNDRLVWACHHEGEFNSLSELNDQIAENECNYKLNEVEVTGNAVPFLEEVG